jgi:predicted nucleic acid-binding protein
MILVDTSVWIEHLRHGNARLRDLLYEEQVLCHPLVIGELACGALKDRQHVLKLLRSLPTAHVADYEEVLNFLDAHNLHDRGLGWIDVSVLAAAVLAQSPLWTADKSLRKAASGLGLSA